jgi:hypothetical protein
LDATKRQGSGGDARYRCQATELLNYTTPFDAELVPFCGKVFRVSTCVERFVDKKSGQLRRMKTPAVILEGVSCKALYSDRRMFCPRSIHLWWREIWLERASLDAYPRAFVSSIQAGACATADKAASDASGVASPEPVLKNCSLTGDTSMYLEQLRYSQRISRKSAQST